MLLLTELGARLKEARLSKGYSLDDLQEITKIQKRYLVGIEEGNYSIMPGTFYVRAFIKQYAEAVGLNPDELLEQFKTDVPGTQTEEVAQSYAQSPSRRKLSSRSSSKMMEAMPKIIVGLFIVVIIVVIWSLYLAKGNKTPDAVDNSTPPFEYDKPNIEKPKPNDKQDDEGQTAGQEDQDAQKDDEEEKPATPQQVISTGVIDGESTIYEVSGVDKLNIRVEVSGDSWVGIRNEQGAEQIDDKVYTAGMVVEHDSTEAGYARIRLGNTTVTKVFVNDIELPFAQDRVSQNIILKLVQEQ
ncbi:helix-turn-helix domain-containing protein [Lysinibacillus sp. 54212]|uniref:helix-turn-helix domain-containing protein n=1 Tax=Lysinibacillus sp. 54212 TaxID=3119829 RepID=UPI002FC98790